MLNPQTRQLFRRLLREHILCYKTHFFMAIGFLILSALSNAAIPYFLKPVFDDIFVSHDKTALVYVCSAIFAVFACRGVAAFGEAVTMTNLGQRVISDIQNRLFQHLINTDYSFFQQHATGRLISIFTNDVNLMRATVSNVIISFTRDTLNLVCLVTLLFVRDPLLAAVSLMLIPIVALFLAKLNKRFRRVIDKAQDEHGSLASYLSQIFQGIRVVKAYCMEAYEVRRMQTQTNAIVGLITKSSQTRALSNPIIDILAGLIISSILVYGGLQVMNGTRTTGDFVSFITALFLAYEPLKRISNVNHSLQEGIIAATRVFKIIDAPTQIQSMNEPIIKPRFQGEITFKDVSFSYPNGKKALRNLNLEILRGQKVAFVGSSGSGKSSLINLVPRFYDAAKGEILIDGQPITHYDLQNLRHNISLVSQEISLFDDTIYNNILYGNIQATKEEVIATAKSAGAHDFIEKLKEGYETLVGENGTRLSGGQRQRIAIARAILKNAPILLLDEATSALDSQSEKHIQDAFITLMQGKTSLVVAHRLSTIVDSDLIYVLENGSIVERGTHHELLQQQQHYYKLWHRQARLDEDTE
ncbi:ABC transporter ATP-binding protein [Candidatus Paracaedibacter symbiosus]|uniref:ABC transporter ATP-binding protein n=1 Tax=Candidatus Paracaedibacter symbiosus TaxID=244582 RepID=UPI001E4C1ADE|nr:ABC transporter ATP-binding protein [Candidatus Paracaedibacter symbiosus]